jgi:hypothetical protein
MNFLLCVLVTLSLALTTAGAFAQVPDTILLDGRIVTADEGSTVHQALAVREGRIVALGKSAEIKRFAGKETRLAAGAMRRLRATRISLGMRWRGTGL